MISRIDELEKLYEQNSDPWNFELSPYEAQKFKATRSALSGRHFDNVLELGCSNGVLASYIAPQSANYMGIDAIKKPLLSAKLKVPAACFEQLKLPAMPFAVESFDLIVMSEILYFLHRSEILEQADLCKEHSRYAEYLLVNYLGETERDLQGEEALYLFANCFSESHKHTIVEINKDYRIDFLKPLFNSNFSK